MHDFNGVFHFDAHDNSMITPFLMLLLSFHIIIIAYTYLIITNLLKYSGCYYNIHHFIKFGLKSKRCISCLFIETRLHANAGAVSMINRLAAVITKNVYR